MLHVVKKLTLAAHARLWRAHRARSLARRPEHFYRRSERSLVSFSAADCLRFTSEMAEGKDVVNKES